MEMARARERPVEVFTDAMLIRGNAASPRRFSDLVNEPSQFLELNSVQAWPYMTDQELDIKGHDHGFINKSTIILVAELTPPETGSQESALWVQKDKRSVVLYSDRFEVRATIFMVSGADMGAALSHPGDFIPFTHATVTPTQPGSRLTAFKRDFLLFNRRQISYLGEDPHAGGEPGA